MRRVANATSVRCDALTGFRDFEGEAMIDVESIMTTLATIMTTYGLRAVGAVVVMIAG